jgi:hypothetical protein
MIRPPHLDAQFWRGSRPSHDRTRPGVHLVPWRFVASRQSASKPGRLSRPLAPLIHQKWPVLLMCRDPISVLAGQPPHPLAARHSRTN